jgi:hypothetical protein
MFGLRLGASSAYFAAAYCGSRLVAVAALPGKVPLLFAAALRVVFCGVEAACLAEDGACAGPSCSRERSLAGRLQKGSHVGPARKTRGFLQAHAKPGDQSHHPTHPIPPSLLRWFQISPEKGRIVSQPSSPFGPQTPLLAQRSATRHPSPPPETGRTHELPALRIIERSALAHAGFGLAQAAAADAARAVPRVPAPALCQRAADAAASGQARRGQAARNR